MLTIARRRTTERPRRSRGAFVLSLAANGLLVAALAVGVMDGYRWSDLLDRGASRDVPAERIGFVQLPRAAGPPGAGRSGGDGRPAVRRPATPTPRPAAPSTVPSEIPAANPDAPAVDPGGSGPIVGTGGATQGIEPSYTDGRLWGRPSTPLMAPRNAKERIDSVIHDRFAGVRDSIIAEQRALANARKPGDWTMEGPGGKWGMDQSSIHLGKVKIPNAILALLSENVQRHLRGNPIQQENDRRLAAIRADLLQHAQREQNEDAFRNAVKEIRARKDRERAERRATQSGTVVADPDR